MIICYDEIEINDPDILFLESNLVLIPENKLDRTILNSLLIAKAGGSTIVVKTNQRSISGRINLYGLEFDDRGVVRSDIEVMPDNTNFYSPKILDRYEIYFWCENNCNYFGCNIVIKWRTIHSIYRTQSNSLPRLPRIIVPDEKIR